MPSGVGAIKEEHVHTHTYADTLYVCALCMQTLFQFLHHSDLRSDPRKLGNAEAAPQPGSNLSKEQSCAEEQRLSGSSKLGRESLHRSLIMHQFPELLVPGRGWRLGVMLGEGLSVQLALLKRAHVSWRPIHSPSEISSRGLSKS